MFDPSGDDCNWSAATERAVRTGRWGMLKESDLLQITIYEREPNPTRLIGANDSQAAMYVFLFPRQQTG